MAALVTFTTMTRMVDEERINAGTLKALGYDDRDVIKKFSFYGAVAGLTGTVIGVLAGHTLLPSSCGPRTRMPTPCRSSSSIFTPG